ncbi:TAXI family TRAP transporter solute-binding subunit [Streptomyces sp. NPDC092296]|uniref:TAXI family TRAP transporter solute-binding subunit n=1 Tax=Streptomyces sp. NPDC092296 TaxID=3366012 RepID=UPI0037FF5BD8
MADSAARPLPRLAAALRRRAASRLWRAGTALVLVAAVLLGWWLSPSAGAAYPKGRVGFATGVPRGVYERYGQLLQAYVRTAMPGVELRLDPSEGSPDNLQRVASGQDAFCIATADAVASYTGPGRSRLRAIARLYDDYMQLVVPADSPVRSVADLRGLKVSVGQPLSGVNLVTRRLLAAAGLDPDRDITPAPLGIGEAVDALRDGRINALFWSGGLPTAAVDELSRELRVRLVPLGTLAEPLHRAGGDGAEAYRAAVMPADAYPAALPANTPVATVAVANLMVTRDDTDTGLVQGMTRAVIDSRDAIGAEVHAAQLVDLRTAIYTDPLPLHEGARRYYASMKP